MPRPQPRIALPVLVLLASLLAAGCGSEVAAPGADAAAGKAAPQVAPNYMSTPRLFAAGLRLSAVAASPSRMLAATVGNAPSKLVRISEDGVAVPFAPEFNAPAELECALECAPGVGSFSQDHVFVGAGSDLWQMAEDGSAALLLLRLPAEEGAIVSLAFDAAGHFDYDLLAMTQSGGVYRIDGQGPVQRVGTFGEGARGAHVASARFGRFAGQLVAAFPAESDVRAMDSAGTVNLVTRWSGAAGAWFVPDDPRAFAATGSTLFLSTEEGTLYRYPLQDLAMHAGELLVTTAHRSGSGLVWPDGAAYRSRPFSKFMGAEAAAAFVRRPTLARIAIDILPGNATNALVWNPAATLPVALLSSTGFLPAILDGGDLTLAGAHAVPNSRGRLTTYTDVNRDGVLDLVTQFRVADMPVAPGDCTLQLDGTALQGDRVRGADRVLVVTP